MESGEAIASEEIQPTSAIPAVGVIGAGAMGMAIAKNLKSHGFPVTIRDIRIEAEREAIGLGIDTAPSPLALARIAPFLIVVVVNAEQIEDVLFGSDGVVHAGSTGLSVCLCSTIAPEDTIRIERCLAQHGIGLIDGPISGGPARAELGTMSMMLAAPSAQLAHWDTVLSAMSDRRYQISEHPGDGARMKLVNNLLAGINLVASAEAFALGVGIGLDPQIMIDVIKASSGSSWVFEDRMPRVLTEDFSPRAASHILTKDVGLAVNMASRSGLSTPLAECALERLRETIRRGWSELDDAVVTKTYLEPTKDMRR